MISFFFIDRPIFAAVLSIVITLAGGLALLWLPIAQYPQITPPSVQVSITYPGASAQVVADTVAAPIEEQVNGVENMLYMSSQCGNDGSYTLTVTFSIGTNLNTALVMVQNRVMLAQPQLPTEVQMEGITIRKKTPDILCVVSLTSPDKRYDDIYLSNYAYINLRDELLRVDGVSDINIFGERDFSIRAWLDPQKMAAYSITAQDVANAIMGQNIQAVAGQVGQPPARRSQTKELPIDTLGRLQTPEQFGDIIVKVGQGNEQNTSAQSSASASSSPDMSTGGVVGASSLSGGMMGMTTNSNATTSSTPSTTTTSSTGSTSTSPIPTSAVTGPATTTTTQGGVASITINSPNGSSGSSTSPSSGGMSNGTSGGMGGSIFNGTSSNGPIATSAPGMSPGGISGSPGIPRVSTSYVRLSEIGRVEIGAASYTTASTFDMQPTVGLAIHQLPEANALSTADRVRQTMEELKGRFPDGVDYNISYDTTPFIRDSVWDVVQTLFEAVCLVAVVVLVFLQSWRSTLIPLIAVPVAIIGTFSVMAGLSAIGTRYTLPSLSFSLNNISLFGLVLAIGIVVDDAIVVVENVERWLEQGLDPREAARRAMNEVTGPIIAVALVLCAVFVPCAFIGGVTGQFFRQFAVTIAASTLFSTFNSLTLSPALAAILLKPHGQRGDPVTRLFNILLGWFFWLFNAVFGAGLKAYGWSVGWLLRGSLVVLVIYAALLVLTGWVFKTAPSGFVPEQDQGRLIVSIQLPDSASLQRTMRTTVEVEKIAHEIPGVYHTLSVSGMSLVNSLNSSNFATLFIILEPFQQRKSPDKTADAIMARLSQECRRRIKDGDVAVFGAPPIPGLSVASGFKIMVEDRSGIGLPALQKQTDAMVAKLHGNPSVIGAQTQFRSNTPQLYLDVDRVKVQSLGVSLGDVDQTMQGFLGSTYVNTFNAFGRYWQVNIQADGNFRSRVSDVNLLQVRNQQSEMVPLGTLVHMRDIAGPVSVMRYNLYTAAPITGSIRPGVSSGDAIGAIDGVAEETLSRTMGTEWTELMFLQIKAGETAFYVFLLAVLLAFLVLAALYESWALPLAVILVVPLCLLCSVGGVLLSHNAVDIFVQIGLVVLVGLACKNAILIVEFAHHLRGEGHDRFAATMEASKLRLRPILMTSLAFILGVMPLVIATGAGAEMRQSLGMAVFSGMVGVTLFGIFLTPVFFYVIQWFSETRLLSSAAMLWIGSAVAGAALGLAFVYLFMQVGLRMPSWMLAAGGCAGALLGLLIPTFQQHSIERNRRAQVANVHEPTSDGHGWDERITGSPS
jgi:multidrug efflux pump